ncbi:hypothetical protein AG1IA_05344 [Rhizoctonia solani AG-1 IA]|uniref:Uncharacterized protein n=1 Tax=Thanatephorus cucumeris (strain AG1-IA) TaxID=983506 RepID=L8WV31_THACA|nr:hypothetical protein AG1IA_05344 [Rhizoctonia solani AG-1 IA]
MPSWVRLYVDVVLGSRWSSLPWFVQVVEFIIASKTWVLRYSSAGRPLSTHSIFTVFLRESWSALPIHNLPHTSTRRASVSRELLHRLDDGRLANWPEGGVQRGLQSV